MAQQATMCGKNWKSFSSGPIKPLWDFKFFAKTHLFLLSGCFILRERNIIKLSCMYIDTHGLVQSYLFCENKDVRSYELLNFHGRQCGQVFLAYLACAPRQLFSRKRINHVQLNEGCSHWGDKGDRRCKLFCCKSSSRQLSHGDLLIFSMLSGVQVCLADVF